MIWTKTDEATASSASIVATAMRQLIGSGVTVTLERFGNYACRMCGNIHQQIILHTLAGHLQTIEWTGRLGIVLVHFAHLSPQSSLSRKAMLGSDLLKNMMKTHSNAVLPTIRFIKVLHIHPNSYYL